MRLHNRVNVKMAGLLLLLAAALFAGVYIKNRKQPQYVDYNRFIEAAGQGLVAAVTLSDSPTLSFTYIQDDTGVTYITDNPRKVDFKEELLLYGVTVTEGASAMGDNLIQVGFSIVVIAGAMYMINRRNNRFAVGAGMRVKSVTSADVAKVYSFEDIAGNAEAKESVADVVDFLKDPAKYTRYGARMPRGILLHGKPGTGKTLMARAMAGEAGVPFYAVSGSDFVQMYVGVGAARVRDLFKKAREAGSAVIFIDEIDALGKKRGDITGGGNDEREQTLNALLTEMSGFNEGEGIVVVAATNRPDTLDEALLRPGRFDRRIEIALPDINARRQILSLHARNKPLSTEVDLDKLAGDTVFFSGAMLEGLLNDAAISAAKRGEDNIAHIDIEKAYYTALAGPEKKDRSTVRERERIVTAYHEAGHALTARLTAPDNRIAKITIIPSSGGAGGFCVNIPPERMYYTKQELEQQIMVYLAGRCAEEVMFGAEQVTTGAANDIEKTTNAVKQYVARFGMSQRVGILDHSDMITDRVVLSECKRLTRRLYEETIRLLSCNRPLLEALAEALLLHETLNGDEMERIFNDITSVESKNRA